MSASQLARAAALGTMPPPPLPERLRTGTGAAAGNQSFSSKPWRMPKRPSAGRRASADPTAKSTGKTIKKHMTRKQAIAAAKALLMKFDQQTKPKKSKAIEEPKQQPPAAAASEKELVDDDETEKQKEQEKRKKQPLADVLERYDRWGVHPPPPLNNQTRFRAFIDRINRRQWESLANVVTSTVKFNGERMSLQTFAEIWKHEFGPGSAGLTTQMEIATLVGGEINPNPPEGKTMKEGFLRDPLAARVTVKNITTDQAEFTRHMIVHFFRGKISSLYDTREEAPPSRKRQAAGKKPPAGSPILRPPPPPVPVDLKKFYREYIAAINLGPEKMADEVPKFCKPSGVTHNGKHLPLNRYISLMQDAMEKVAGLKFKIHTLVVGGQKQMIAARLEFKGTPVKTYMGATPTGDEVEWSEHVFYWLENSKISDVISIVDWDTYRDALGQGFS